MVSKCKVLINIIILFLIMNYSSSYASLPTISIDPITSIIIKPPAVITVTGKVNNINQSNLIFIEITDPLGKLIVSHISPVYPNGDFIAPMNFIEQEYESGIYQIKATLVVDGKKIIEYGVFVFDTEDKYSDIDSVQSNGGGCLIATATYGSELEGPVQELREIRDNILLKTKYGIAFMDGFNNYYYIFSPTVADWERENPILKELIKITIIPLLTTLSILTYFDVDSEEEVLGYGLGIIFLNVGIYIVTPAFTLIQLNKKLKFIKF